MHQTNRGADCIWDGREGEGEIERVRWVMCYYLYWSSLTGGEIHEPWFPPSYEHIAPTLLSEELDSVFVCVCLCVSCIIHSRYKVLQLLTPLFKWTLSNTHTHKCKEKDEGRLQVEVLLPMSILVYSVSPGTHLTDSSNFSLCVLLANNDPVQQCIQSSLSHLYS